MGNVKNYFVFVLMMVGVIDDFKDALNELLRAANLPISVIVVKMGKNYEDNDSAKFIKQSQGAFEESERIFLDLYNFENYKKDDGDHSLFFQQQLQYDLIRSIPRQIEKYFEMQNYEMDAT